MPRVVSERRPYFTVAHLPASTIASDQVFKADDPDGYLFAVASSSMFITWQKAIGGRLKSDLRFSNTLVWNNLPLPDTDKETRQKIIDAGHAVLQAREIHLERSLAEHYNPLAMDPQLVRAHDKLDAAVDSAFGTKRSCKSEKERQEILFARYAELEARKQ